MPAVSNPRAFGAEAALTLGFVYYFWAYHASGEPSPVVTAVVGAVAATVALAVGVFEARGGRPPWQQALIEWSKGAGAGATVIFATLVSTDLPDAQDWVGLIFFGASVVVVLIAESGKRVQRNETRDGGRQDGLLG